MLIDTHCHLDAVEFDSDRDEVHAGAVAAGVEMIVVPAIEVREFAKTRDAVARHAGCFAAYGIHPLYVMQADDGDPAILRQWLERERPVAVGEIGIDLYVSDIDPQRQEFFFVEQLKLAREFDLPVLLHVRRAVDPILKLLRRFRVRGGIAHAFNGSRQQAVEFIKLGFALGFGGAMTFSGSTRIRTLAAELPLESIVLETDAPDIPPAWLDGGRNEPAQLPAIAAALAELRAMPIDQVATITSANAFRVLPGLCPHNFCG
ncbi:MAG: TatD family hydrolase [Betaproteobacteria bacterium]|nr:TatD family hydrolase [Betaproteobacteria bacterium]